MDAGLLGFIAGVHLDEQLDYFALLSHFAGNGLGDAWPVDGVDDVEQANCISSLVCLQGANQM